MVSTDQPWFVFLLNNGQKRQSSQKPQNRVWHKKEKVIDDQKVGNSFVPVWIVFPPRGPGFLNHKMG